MVAIATLPSSTTARRSPEAPSSHPVEPRSFQQHRFERSVSPTTALPTGPARTGRPGGSRSLPRRHVGGGAATRPATPVVARATPTFDRLAVIVLALVATIAVLGLVRSPAPSATTDEVPVHVVREGDSMWSIAVETAPAGEVAVYVERLVAANGGATVVPGQSIVLPRP